MARQRKEEKEQNQRCQQESSPHHTDLTTTSRNPSLAPRVPHGRHSSTLVGWTTTVLGPTDDCTHIQASDTSIQHVSSGTDFSPCPPCSRAHCFCLKDLCLVFSWISTDAYTWLRAASRNPYVHIQTVITVIMPVVLQHYCYRINRKRVKFCI